MIYCSNKTYGRVWKVTKSEKYIDLQISTSEKDSQGATVYSQWYPRVVGHAFNTIKDKVKEGDTVMITKAKLSQEKYKDKEGNTKYGLKFVVFEADIVERDTNEGNAEPSFQQAKSPDASGGDTSPW